MNDPSEGILVLELAYLVGELSRRHTELLGSMRSFRAGSTARLSQLKRLVPSNDRWSQNASPPDIRAPATGTHGIPKLPGPSEPSW